MKRSFWILCFAFAACGRGGATTQTPTPEQQKANLEFSDAAPDVDALTLDEDASQSAGAARDAAGPASGIAGHVKVAVKDLNDSIKAVLGQVATMTKTQPTTTSDGTRVWTASKNDIDYKLSIHKAAVGVFGWKLEAKKTADADYTRVMGGKLKRRSAELAPRHGAGSIGIDLTAYKAIAEGTPGAITKAGKIFAAFQRGPEARRVLYRLKDFQKDTTSTALPISAYFNGLRIFAKDPRPALAFMRAGGRFNVADFSDLAGPANETVTARLRRIVGVGGFGRAVIREGDLPAGTRRVVRECWNSPVTGTESLYQREVWDCTGARNAQDGTFPTCTLFASARYPQLQNAPNDPPEAPATRARFLAACFPNNQRLAMLAANDPALTDDPNDAEEIDETPPEAAEGQPSGEATNIETDDANVVDAADDLDDVDAE